MKEVYYFILWLMQKTAIFGGVFCGVMAVMAGGDGHIWDGDPIIMIKYLVAMVACIGLYKIFGYGMENIKAAIRIENRQKNNKQ